MKNDRQLQHDVLAELDRQPAIGQGTIGAEVHHGTVKLSGSVADETMRTLAEGVVRRVDGVGTVILDIRVRAPNVAAPRAVPAPRRIPEHA